MKMHYTFIRSETAYDRVPRYVIYWCLKKKAIIEKTVRTVIAMCQGARTEFRAKCGETEELGD